MELNPHDLSHPFQQLGLPAVPAANPPQPWPWTTPWPQTARCGRPARQGPQAL